MKNVLVLVFLILVCPALVIDVKAQSGWQWGAGSPHMRVEADASTIDKDENVIYWGRAFDDSLIIAGSTLSTAGMFVTKLSSSGTFLWGKEADFTYGLTPLGITTDLAGNIYALGIYTGGPTTYAFALGVDTFYKPYNYAEYFMIKFSKDGDVRWVKNLTTHDVTGALSTAYYGDLGTDSLGNVYITGIFNTYVDTLGPVVLHGHGAGNYDAFLARLDTSGNVVWAKNFGGYSDENVSALSVSNNTIYITGQYQSGTLFIDDSSLVNPATGNLMAFTAAFTTSGTLKWARNIGLDVYPADMKSDASGSAYITASFAGTIVVGTTSLSASGPGDMLLAKYDASGHVVWATSGGGNRLDRPYSMDLDNACGTLWICGMVPWAPYTMNFQGHTLATPGGVSDPIFIVGYNTDGVYKAATWLPSGGDDFCGIVASRGNFYITGDFALNPLIINHDTLKLRPPFTAMVEYLFVAKYGYAPIVNNVTDTILCASAMAGQGAFTVPGYLSYLWNTGSATSSAHIDSSGTYWFTGRGECAITNDTFHITLVNTFPPCIADGINDPGITEANDISVFPNPVSQALTIRSVGKIETVTISNPVGRTVLSQNYSKSEVIIDVSRFPPGMYFARINGSETRKFIKE